MIKENPLCQNLTIGKRGRPKNADKILKENSKRQKVAEEEQSSAPRTAIRHGEPAQQPETADVDTNDLHPHQHEARQSREANPNPPTSNNEDKHDPLDL